MSGLANQQNTPDTLGFISYLKFNAIFSKYQVIDASGNGDYRTFEEAMLTNNKLFFVASGTYTLTKDLIIKGQSFIGESPDTVIIDMDSFQIIFEDDGSYQGGVIDLRGSSQDVITYSTWSFSGGPSEYDDPWLKTNYYPFKIRKLSISSVAAEIEINRHEGSVKNFVEYNVVDLCNYGTSFSGIKVLGSKSVIISGIGVSIENCAFIKRSVDLLHFEVGTSTRTSYGFRIKNCLIQGAKLAFSIEKAPHTTIDSCAIYSERESILITGAASGLLPNYTNIINNQFIGCLGEDVIKVVLANYCRIDNNFFRTFCNEVCWFENANFFSFCNNKVHHSYMAFILDRSSSGNIVGNSFYGLRDFIEHAFDNCDSILISENYIESISVQLSPQYFWRIINNTFVSDEIEIDAWDRGLFCNNTIDGATVLIQCERWIVSGNVLKNTNNGVSHAINVITDHVILKNNGLISPLAGGIYIKGNFCLLSNNNVRNSVGIGIEIDSDAGAGYNVISNNIVLQLNVVTWGIVITKGISVIVKNLVKKSGLDGINLMDSDKSVLHSNICYSSSAVGTRGILIDATSDRVAGTGNVSQGFGTNLTNNGTNTDFAHNITV